MRSPEELLRATDHTNLSPRATREDILALCDEGLIWHTASVCIPPVYVAAAREYLESVCPPKDCGGRPAVCTVIGFPNGYMTPAAKRAEAADAVKNGAEELDMVICNGAVREGRYADILSEIRDIKAAAQDKVVKVIVETCYLTREQKIRLCEVVSESGADFIKTSTGFGTGGAVPEDIALFAQHIAPHVRIKAAGGIASFEDADRFLTLGASRLGTSRLVGLAKQRT